MPKRSTNCKKTEHDKAEKGASYTKGQFVVLLGKDPKTAKDILISGRDKQPKPVMAWLIFRAPN